MKGTLADGVNGMRDALIITAQNFPILQGAIIAMSDSFDADTRRARPSRSPSRGVFAFLAEPPPRRRRRSDSRFHVSTNPKEDQQ